MADFAELVFEKKIKIDFKIEKECALCETALEWYSRLRQMQEKVRAEIPINILRTWLHLLSEAQGRMGTADRQIIRRFLTLCGRTRYKFSYY